MAQLPPLSSVVATVVVTHTGSTIVVTSFSTISDSPTRSTTAPLTTPTSTTLLSVSSTEPTGDDSSSNNSLDSPGPDSAKDYRVGIAIGIPLAILLCVAAIVVFCCYRRRATRRNKNMLESGATAKYPAPLRQPHVGELEGNHADTRIYMSKNNLSLSDLKQLPEPTIELPAHSPYMHPTELSSTYNKSEIPSSEMMHRPSAVNDCQTQDATLALTAMTNKDKPIKSTPTPSRSSELEALLKRREQLEDRKRRMLELHKVEEEQAEIEERIQAMSQAQQKYESG